MNKIGILYHPMNQFGRSLAEELKSIINAKRLDAWIASAWEEVDALRKLDKTDLILSIGGDGTILRAAQVALVGNIPITGVNIGNLGFMTEMGADEIKDKIDAIISGSGWIDERSMLEVILNIPGRQVYHVLNDAVLTRGNVVRTTTIEVFINEEPFIVYQSDGVILSTATGSTGYSLSAGGPILYPSSTEFILTPVMPHLNKSFSTVLPTDSTVRLVNRSVIPVTLSLDGHTNPEVGEGAFVEIKRSSHTTRFLRLRPHNSFYRTLEQKLKGKQYR
jgi:NAD+ kinase